MITQTEQPPSTSPHGKTTTHRTSRPNVMFGGVKEFLSHHIKSANASVDHSKLDGPEAAGSYYTNHWTANQKPHQDHDVDDEQHGNPSNLFGGYYTNHWTAMKDAR
ncbi:hypothetical protein IV203_004665 [Nitzschia inconspicua]|uniref:Uncharacterized protein n=1 Tax=Nitzschia inconspicua TaxID=303405 RepID=A0A9K3L448_9STRA|nr:hypothetical protein IV203_004665 [Nitzschia inconspicua]